VPPQATPQKVQEIGACDRREVVLPGARSVPAASRGAGLGFDRLQQLGADGLFDDVARARHTRRAARLVMAPQTTKFRTLALAAAVGNLEGVAAAPAAQESRQEAPAPACRLAGAPLHIRVRFDHLLVIPLPLVCWMWIVVMARDMYGPMTGASAWMMTATWDARHLLLLWAMWAVMMAGMMLPSAAPMLLMYGALARRSATAAAASRQIHALAAGYLAAWTLFSLGATALQRVLGTLLFVSSMMEVTSPRVGATLLFIAGIYQLTPMKHVCLRTCQSPLDS
jgi:hypothetical protein